MKCAALFMVVLFACLLLLEARGGAQEGSVPLSEAVIRFAAREGIRLPKDVRLTPPGPEVPPERAAFLGSWFGRWDDGHGLSHILIVQEITKSPSRMSGIYAWGGAISDWRAVKGGFTGATLYLDRTSAAQVTYRMVGAELEGVYELARPFWIRMQRIKD